MAAEGHRMALRCTASASKRPEEVRKPQQGLAARFKLCGRKPLRGLPPLLMRAAVVQLLMLRSTMLIIESLLALGRLIEQARRSVASAGNGGRGV